MIKTQTPLPPKLKAFCVGRVCDNLTRKIRQPVLDRMKDGLGHGTYPADGFYGYAWYAEGNFWLEVWRNQVYVGTYNDPSFLEVVKAVCDEYGYD